MTSLTDFVYPKISGPWMRSEEKPHPLLPGHWAKPEFAFLRRDTWIFHEKIDGTNLRIIWDGYGVEFRGRTNSAQWSPKNAEYLLNRFVTDAYQELLEQAFGRTAVILYGELFGPGIQKGGGDYGAELNVAIFDIFEPERRLWYSQDAVAHYANELGIDRPSCEKVGPLEWVLDEVTQFGFDFSAYSTMDRPKMQEGLVGRPRVELFDRWGVPIRIKLKPSNVA